MSRPSSANGHNSQGRRQQGSRSGGKHQTVLDQLSLLKMSPVGGAANLGIAGLGIASLGIVCCKARSRTPGRASSTALHRLPFVKSSLGPVGPGHDASAAPLYPAIVPVQQQFSPLGYQSRPNLPVLIGR